MKLSFKKFCCIGLALLFSFNLANVSLSVKAAPTSSVTEKEVAVVQSDEHGNVVVTKEMLQEPVISEEMAREIAHLYSRNRASKIDKILFVASLLLPCCRGVVGIWQICLKDYVNGTKNLALACGGFYGWFIIKPLFL